MTHDSLIIPSASSISPAVSLAKTDSSVSYYNDYLVDVPSNDRSLREESSSGIRILQQEHESCDGNGGIDSHIWFPPEPEDREADMEGSIGNYEDDDDDEEYGDGMKWGKPSNLSSLREEGCGSFRFREETKKAMDEVMNGKFKALVEHLLTSMGISCSGNDMDTDTDTWVDTVTALSWEAASYLKPDAFEGKAMDPDGYVKIKCFATGSRTQSKVFKGLVFKKHAAHKHMPTKYRKPKLLLIKGALSVSSDGLSSFESMKQENERLDYLIGMIEKLNPNVVLVEKTVSRDIQESILAKGMTLVLEMKLHRLERVARCTGSPILSSDMLLLNDQKLRQCESFYFEKIVEEHAALCDNGKRPKKTLMFLQGCPTRMGFTILLMGSHSDELKTIKCVVQFAVVMAYHLILESSFLVNQRAMLSTTAPNGMAILSTKPVFVYKGLDIPVASESSMETTTSDNLITTIDIPISNGFLQENGPDNLGLEGHSLSSYEPYDPIVLSGLSSLSASLQEVVGYPLFNATPQDQDHEEEEEEEETYLGYNTPLDRTETSSPDTETELLRRNLSLETKDSEERMQRKDDITAVLDSESILVLMSRRNVTRGTTCKQSSFSCIKFYRNFDVPLGKFLQDNLLNQLLCGTCNELPEAHLSYYAHQNKQLTIQVKRLPSDKQLPGENEGKLWMWSCCGQCKPSNGSLKSTKRVLVSVAARGLSFGKFLELGFSNHSSWEIPSSCGHSSYADYFHFFGSGSMVAMFRYSTVATYSVSLPHWKVEFTNSIERDFLKEEVADVYQEGQSVFAEVENSLKKMEDKFGGSTLNIQGSCKRFSDIKEMLNKEQDEYEKLSESTSMTKWLYKPLHLNYIQWEVLLRSYIWDERIHSLLSSNLIRVTVDPQTVRESQRPHLQEKDTTTISITENGEPVSDNIKIYTHTPEPREANGLSVQPITTEAVVDDENGGVSSAFSSKSADPKGWMWTPFSHIESIYVKDLHRGYLPKYEASGSSRIHKMITQSQGEEGSKIHFPLGLGTENLLMVSDYEDELSSMIACALAFLKDGNSNTSLEFASDDSKSYESLPKMLSLSSPNWSSFTSMDSDVEDSRFSSFDGLELLDSVAANSRYLHPVISMGRLANRSKYSVACLFAKDFLDLRGQCGLSELDYISSLSRCKHWDAKGGKSKSFFAKTLDDRFIIKEIKKTEFYSFLEFASHYFGYMNQCFKLGNQTCLAKILGIYQVKKRKSGAKHDLMVMENISYGRKITRQYDLKGALYARFNAVVDGTGDVLLDQNFVNDMNVSPLYVNTKAKRNLQRAVWNDTAFLNSINVMDYSLLVGVDVEEKELVCGIIDYVRQYTWDKQLENWVKSFVVPKNQLPTIISPKEYKKRFRKFIDTHFFSVPDDWCSQRPSNRCTLCGSNTPNPKMK
uniref:1-phosphatidylinositol-3-phosphate 5-kinase n=1 Tax=Lactuca sativa TaxID=4236 RepID=A0A9R1VWP3_LACSA|nr:hypothetical protein LSAT_V11C400209230 [Lactuca sativa]